MGHLDTSLIDEGSYETRELCWELQQAHPDTQRIKFLIEREADLKRAMLLAHIQEKELLKRPELRHLQLHRYLRAAELLTIGTQV